MSDTNDKVVFCTSLIDHDKERYENWYKYYANFFSGCGIDLWMINDGPANNKLDYDGLTFKEFENKLGRNTVWIFPGWKRSFFHGVFWLREKYKYIAHIESDCWITESGKGEFLYHLCQSGYFTGFTPSYNFPETGLQILNSNSIRQYIVDKYSCFENWYENIDFEKDLEQLKPSYILYGDRIENHYYRFNSNFTFLSSTSYIDFKRLYGI